MNSPELIGNFDTRQNELISLHIYIMATSSNLMLFSRGVCGSSTERCIGKFFINPLSEERNPAVPSIHPLNISLRNNKVVMVTYPTAHTPTDVSNQNMLSILLVRQRTPAITLDTSRTKTIFSDQ